MHSCLFLIFSLLLVRLETPTANQFVAVEEGRDDSGVMNQCMDKERHALLEFKAGLHDPYAYLSTWGTEEDDCCRWKEVTCNNKTGHVTGLDISLLDLEGEISHSLLNLTFLNHLDLLGNSFHGTIPTFIGSMTRLRYLDLSMSGFEGTIVTSIGSLTELRHLNLHSNNLNGTIPRSIGSLTKLRFLDLSDNSLHGTIPSEFGNLTNLKRLFLGISGRCRVENLEWLSHLSHLQNLDMNGISLAKANHWVDVIQSLRELSHLSLTACELSHVMYPYSSFLNSSSSIVGLSLGNNNLTSSMHCWLFPLTSNKLHDLDLSNNMLDGIPIYLGNLSSLTTLSLNDNSAVVDFPDFLNNLSGSTSLTLQVLYAPSSQFTGSLPDEFQKFSSLEYLDLSQNHLNGSISENLWELPRLETLDVSSNYLRGSISANIGKSKLINIDLSNNSLQGVPSTVHVSNLSSIESIGMKSCKLGPRFPKWIKTLKNLTSLDISNSRILDTIPMEFWDTWPSQLQYLNLSSNNISGKAPNLSSNFDYNSVIDLSSNSFYGPILNVSSSLVSLNLSRNKFSGGISFLCQIVDGFLKFLDLSHNNLRGQLPDCFWLFKELKVLNLGNNNLFGRLPASIGSMINLEAFHLYKNNFFGELPLSLNKCTSLNSLNLGANKFSGNLPVWSEENLPEFFVLILRSNNFFGTIPLQLCRLAHLHVLDLSMNNLHGTIPSCFNNLTSMVQEGFSQEHDFYYYGNGTGSPDLLDVLAKYVDHAMIKWQGDEREFFRNLRLLKMIDLSSNNLTGLIPKELANLYELVALNLSKNTLHGEIPWGIGQMSKLLALDLSRNNLSGWIPSSMSQMTFLSYLDVSCNNLSGRIPSSTQLQSFEPSRYDGNAGLCGLPLPKTCPGDENSKVPPVMGKTEGDGEGIDELEIWFYIGGVSGFVTGFWIVCGALILNRRWRHAFFHFYDSFKDWVYVKVMVFIANCKRLDIRSFV